MLFRYPSDLSRHHFHTESDDNRAISRETALRLNLHKALRLNEARSRPGETQRSIVYIQIKRKKEEIKGGAEQPEMKRNKLESPRNLHNFTCILQADICTSIQRATYAGLLITRKTTVWT